MYCHCDCNPPLYFSQVGKQTLAKLPHDEVVLTCWGSIFCQFFRLRQHQGSPLDVNKRSAAIAFSPTHGVRPLKKHRLKNVASTGPTVFQVGKQTRTKLHRDVVALMHGASFSTTFQAAKRSPRPFGGQWWTQEKCNQSFFRRPAV